MAYDDEGGGRASRLLWMLDVVSHFHYPLLSGTCRAYPRSGELRLDERH
ncbi:MAG: hypothetical protein HY082_10690 [Gammaproteobacteria bacterium]|nr:hypothetical protein [Gammaproteobacteria bacterium]